MDIYFKNSKITLYDKYLVYKDFIDSTEITIRKDDIEAFYSGITTSVTTSHSGSVGVSAKVTNGLYIRSSTPYHNKNFHTKYSPKIILKDGRKYYLGDSYEADGNLNTIRNNLNICNKWSESENLNALSIALLENNRNFISIQ